MIKLVLSDMDGTLLPFSEQRVSARTHAAIAELRAAGIEFGLATGRNVAELTKIFEGDTAAFRTGILGNGMRVVVDGEDRMLGLIDRADVLELADFVQETPGVLLCIYAHDDTGTMPILRYGCTEDEYERFCRNIFPLPAIATEEVPYYPIAGVTIASFDGQGALDEALAQAAEAVPRFDYLQSAICWCDVLPKGRNKASALTMLLGELGLSPDEVLFFGDADNDLPLMGVLDNTVAMGNATPAAAAAARWHVGNSEDDGAAKAFEELARATRAGETPTFMR